MKKIFCLIVACSILLLAVPTALAKTILYVPADDRPVSLEYAVDTLKAANIDILVPPAEYLAGRQRTGDPEGLWQWVKDNAAKADALVLSGDSLIYGGLVDSRIHNFSSNVLEWRLKRFSKLRAENPSARMYIFSTIMRSPIASSGGVEPAYYETYGNDIFQLTALQDKAESKGLTVAEQQTLQRLAKTIPREYIKNWMERRDVNFSINTKLIELTKTEIFNYLIIGRDDTSPFSQSHKESRMLSKLTDDLPPGTYASFPGADQLGMILLARAYNAINQQTPVVSVNYALGAEAATVASYEDQPIGRTISDHITAAGGIVAGRGQQPDLVLAVNTPLGIRTEEAEAFDNLAIETDSILQFVTFIESQLRSGTPVAVADVAFANGADNSLMRELYRRGLLDRLDAYSGWNTASNTLGYAIGQGMMAKTMSDEARKRLLMVRYLDDWAYQANIRKEIYREVFSLGRGSSEYLNWLEPEVTTKVENKIRLFVQRYLWGEPKKVQVVFPWHRMFEVQIKIDQ